MNNNKQIWDSGHVNSQGVKETPKPYMYFQEYLKLGAGRSIRKLHEDLKVRQNFGETSVKKTISQRQLEKYSSNFDWVERATAFDNHLQKKYLDSIIQNQSKRAYWCDKIENEEVKEFKDINKEMRSVIKVLLNNIRNLYDLLQEGEITQREFSQDIRADLLGIYKLYGHMLKSRKQNHDAIYDYLNINRDNKVNDNITNNNDEDWTDCLNVELTEEIERDYYEN